MSEIEDIILDNDQRGVSALKIHLPNNFCEIAAQIILDNPGPVLICTGFLILSARSPETDGPPGAYFLGQALEQLGHSVTYVTDIYSAFLFKDLVSAERIIEFPIISGDESKELANKTLGKINPSIVIGIERCGLTNGNMYLNMRGVDISEYTAKLDYLFQGTGVTIGIGDGGNEIGMGNVAHAIPSVETLPDEPAITKVNQLIIASVSNWGGYGLIAALSLLSKRNLLPTAYEEEKIIKQMVDIGAVDGISGQNIYAVDGFSLTENRLTLDRLSTILAKHELL